MHVCNVQSTKAFNNCNGCCQPLKVNTNLADRLSHPSLIHTTLTHPETHDNSTEFYQFITSFGCCLWAHSIIGSRSGFTINLNPKWIRLILDTPKAIRFAKWIWTQIHCKSGSGSDNRTRPMYTQTSLKWCNFLMNFRALQFAHPSILLSIQCLFAWP